MWTMLLFAGCVGAPDTAGTDGEWTTLYGHIRHPDRDDGLEGVDIVDVARPDAHVVTGEDGRWALDVAAAPYVTLRFTLEGYLPIQAWIAPAEVSDPAHEYPMRMGGTAVVASIYQQFGATLEPGRVFLLVDAMDPGMSDIFGATVEISSAHDGVWREAEDGSWVAENRTNEDRMDLLFANVEPGPVTLTMVAPDGTPCELPPDVTLVADEVTQVSGYCSYVQPKDPADTAEDH